MRTMEKKEERETLAEEHTYIAIDLKSFYASVECVERSLNPLTTNLVVADVSRTEKTICLAVSPSLKAYGIPGRARLFEVVQKVREVNAVRRSRAPGGKLAGESCFVDELQRRPELALSYIAAVPRMAHYMEYSAKIYRIYLKYIAPEDIHVYSIDEIFADVSSYLKGYAMTARELAGTIIQDILTQTGITATAGIGSNLYLCKVALDIEAKQVKPDENGVRIAELNERKYRELLWEHRPLTDFWRVGKGYAKKLEESGLFTMGDIARCSLGKDNEFHNEELLYRLFGVNAELLIDHAWGWEPTTIALVKQYKPGTSCISSGQVLQCPYDFERGKLVIKEMADFLALDLVEKRLVTDQIVLTVGYDMENLADAGRRRAYKGEVTVDRYGRRIPKHAHGTANLRAQTSSTEEIMRAVLKLYENIVNPNLLIRRVNITANNLTEEDRAQEKEEKFVQMDLFTDYRAMEQQKKEETQRRKKERALQEAVLSVKHKYGKNAMLKGMNLEEGSTGRLRNSQIGGHRA